MLYSCTHVATVGVKGLIISYVFSSFSSAAVASPVFRVDTAVGCLLLIDFSEAAASRANETQPSVRSQPAAGTQHHMRSQLAGGTRRNNTAYRPDNRPPRYEFTL